MNEEAKQGSYVGQAWLVILLALLYGGALAGVETTLRPLIEENRRNETYSKIPGLVGIPEPLSDADRQRITIEEKTVQGQHDKRPHRVYQAFFDGALEGWVLPAVGQGFADRIELLIGLDAELSTITGLYVLDQKETPGLGDYISRKDFRSHFQGRPTDTLLVAVKSEPRASHEIRALSGATISSQSVCTIVNRAIANLKKPIRQQALAPEEATAPHRPVVDQST